MNAFKAEITAILYGLMGNPSTTTDVIILLATAALTCIVGLRISSSVFGLKRTAWWAVICVFVVTSAVVLAAVASARIFLLDKDSSTALRLGLQIGAAVLVVLAIGIPLQILLQKANYLESMSCFAATIIITSLITAGTNAALNAVRSGSTQMEKAAERNKQIDVDTGGATR